MLNPALPRRQAPSIGTASLWIAIILLTLLRWWLASSHELQEDESYYYQWSLHPALSYYSKGPGVAMTILAGTKLFGATELGVRFFPPLLALGTCWMAWNLTRRFFGDIPAAWTALLLNVIPIFTAGSMLMTIDSLSLFFWAAFLCAAWRAFHSPRGSCGWWILAGVAIGLGFLCKYTAFLQWLSVALLCAVSADWRKKILRPGLIISILVSLLTTLPVWLWNARHGWITVQHLQERGKLDQSTGLHPADFFEYLGAHAGVYSPIIFVGLCWALYKGVRLARQSESAAFVTVFSVPVILLYFVLSFREAGEPNWTCPGFFGAALLLPHYWREYIPALSRLQWWKHAGLALGMLMSLILTQTDLVRAAGIPLGYTRDKSPPPYVEKAGFMERIFTQIGDPSQRMRGWKETASVVKEVLDKVAAQSQTKPFLIANRWQSASELAFYLPQNTPLFQPSPDVPRVQAFQRPHTDNQYAFWPRYDQGVDGKFAFQGHNAVYVTDDWRKLPTSLTKQFRTAAALPVAEVYRDGLLVRRLQFYYLQDYVAPHP